MACKIFSMDMKQKLQRNYLLLICVFIQIADIGSQTRVSLKKERTTPKPRVECAANQFTCSSHSKCIDYIKTCDEEYDCSDTSDEYNCYSGYTDLRKNILLCTLPNQTIDRSYELDCYDGVSAHRRWKMFDKHASEFSTITHICNPGYTRENENNIFESYCIDKNWSPAIPECKKICERLFPSKDLTVECYRNDEKINCNEPLLSGTEVRATCKPYRRQVGIQSEKRMICENGQWNGTLPECVLECGKVEGDESSSMVFGNTFNYNHFPWHVAIYNVEKTPVLICSGTIVSPILIITAVACVNNEKTKKSQDVSNFEVVVSKITPDYYFQDNEFQKSYNVHKIFTTDVLDIAILEVVGEILFSYGVSPACFLSNLFISDLKGRVASWGITDLDNVHETDFRIDEYITEYFYNCTRENNKFCGQQTYGAGTNISDAGSGFIYYDQETNQYHLLGVMNTKYKFQNNFVVICSNLNDESTERWIHLVLQRTTNQRIIDNAVLNFNTRPDCEYKTTFDVTLQKASVCLTRKENAVIPPCKRTCNKLLQPQGMILTCTYNNIEMNCDQELLTSGVKVSFRCIDGYKPKHELDYHSIECQENGKWSDELFPCIQDDIRSCALPPVTGDKTYTIDCDPNRKGSKSEEYVKELTMLSFQCNPGYYYQELAPENKNFFCEPNHYYQEKLNNFQVICVNGSWSPRIGNCAKLCKAFTSINLKPECYYNNEKIDCNQPLFAGTRMRPLCQEYYHKKYEVSTEEVEELTCNKNGEWDGFPIECIPYCGRNSPYDLLANDYQEIPYHVSINEKKIGSQICGGTLISPHLVLTAARCFYDPVKKRLGNADRYEIIVGKKVKRLSLSLNEDVLKFSNYKKVYQVKTIYFTNKGKNKIVANYSQDLAVLESVQKIEFNINAIPACVNWNQSDKFNSYSYFSLMEDGESPQPGHVAKWGGDHFENDGTYVGSEILLATFLHYQYTKCQQYTQNNAKNNSDLFCLYNPDKENLASKKNSFETSDYGSGYLHVSGVGDSRESYKYYVQGVMSSKTANESFYQVINVNYHAKWLNRIRLHVEKRRTFEEAEKYFDVDGFHKKDDCENALSHLEFGSDPTLQISCKGGSINKVFSNGCNLPERKLYNIDYEHSCPKNIYQNYCKEVSENGSVPKLTELNYHCLEGFAIPITGMKNNLKSFCTDGWVPPIQECRKYCNKLKPINVKLNCYYNEIPISCEGNLGQNTVVVPECQREYEPESNPSYKEITCLPNGEWSNVLYRCKPKCGTPASNVTTLIRGGHEALFGEFPWHVAIYDKAINNTLICGGSIISPYVIVSAAHCFYDQQNNIVKPASNYVIAVGKISRDINKKDSGITAFYEVEKIILENFLGITLRYQYDIAILQIKDKIIFNAQVIPICFRQSSTAIIPSGEILHVCGWGIDDTDKHSSTLRAITMPYLSISECVKKAPDHITQYISVDKFCVENVNGSIVDSGDSGGGLSRVDKATSLHYLVGIVSFKAADLPTVAVITDATQDNYVRWINKQMNEIHRAKQYDI